MIDQLLHRIEAQDARSDENRRLIRNSTVAGLGCALFCLLVSILLARWDWALGLLIGSGLSLSNFRLLANSASKWFGQTGAVRTSSIWKGFLARLLLSGVVLAVSILYLPINVFGLAIGLFVVQGALLLSFFRQGMRPEGR
jgi:hypothetical protein